MVVNAQTMTMDEGLVDADGSYAGRMSSAMPDIATLTKSLFQCARRNADEPLDAETRVVKNALPTPSKARRWFSASVEKIGELSQLERNWDSYGAHKIYRSSQVGAIEFLLKLKSRKMPAPSIVPTNTGGVQIEWHCYGVDLEVECFSDGKITGYYEILSSGKEWEGELGPDLTEIKRALALLSGQG